MKQDDFDFIERELNIKLPESYKKIALEAKLAKLDRAECFYDDPQKLVEMNKRLRKRGLHGKSWKDNHFAFSYEKDGGAYHFIDLDVEDGEVYLARPAKSWRYSPEDLSNNERLMKLSGYINFWYKLIMLRLNPTPTTSDEEFQRKLNECYEEINRICEENRKKMELDK